MMGLKYKFFIVKKEAKQLLTDLLKITGMEDSTYLMIESRRWNDEHTQKYKDMCEEAKLLNRDELSDEDKKELDNKFEEWVSERPTYQPLKEYMAEQTSQSVNWFNIWFMEHPTNPNFVLGGYTSFGYSFDRTFESILWVLLNDAGIHNWWHVNFSHVCNDGDITSFKNVEFGKLDSVKVHTYAHRKGEDERFERYVKRVSKMIGVPFDDLHDFIWRQDRMPWQHEVRIWLNKEDNPYVEK
jgi:hypothetical protein